MAVRKANRVLLSVWVFSALFFIVQFWMVLA
jgi:hypothetical protein